MSIPTGGIILDPFLGSATTAVTAQLMGIYSIGYDVLPMSQIATVAKGSILNYKLYELKDFRLFVESLNSPASYNQKLITCQLLLERSLKIANLIYLILMLL